MLATLKLTWYQLRGQHRKNSCLYMDDSSGRDPNQLPDDALKEFQEMEQIYAEKKRFSDLFDRMDPEQNGDVEETEWILALKGMNVNISESDMIKLFQLMDGDKSNYIDRQDWIAFCMTKYESKELQRLHDTVLEGMGTFTSKGVANMLLEIVDTATVCAYWIRTIISAGSASHEYLTNIVAEYLAIPPRDWSACAVSWTPKGVAFWLESISSSWDNREKLQIGDFREMLSSDFGIEKLEIDKVLQQLTMLRQNPEEFQNMKDQYQMD